ncbi:protein kinase [Streptomyces arenae]|nr:protein kinase [Streptomyces arenae]
MSSEGPYEPPEGALSLINPHSKRLVLDRRGSTVWEVATDFGPYAVKVGYPTETHAWTALAPAREAAVLWNLSSAHVLSGEWERGTWNAQPWHKGDSLHELWAPHRRRESTAQPPIADALACARALAALHDKGCAHGDVQPAHFILRGEPATAALIDVALVHGAEVPQQYDFAYRGCLVHYESPEIARRVLVDGMAVPTQQADIYGLGATLFMAATGWRHVEYPDDAPRTEQRQAIVNGTHRSVNVVGPLGQLIKEMLRYEPNDRPSIHEVCGVLEKAAD